MAALAIVRNQMPGLALFLNLALTVVFSAGLGLICWMGYRHRWLPSRSFLTAQLEAKLPFFKKFSPERAHV
jgi:hypothetical protein